MGMKQSMKLEYYTGEINSHVDYLKIIKMLEMKSEYIEYVLVDADDAKIIDYYDFEYRMPNNIFDFKKHINNWGYSMQEKNQLRNYFNIYHIHEKIW